MADRVPHVKHVAPIPRKASPKQDATSPPRRQRPSTTSVLPAWLGGHYGMLAGGVAALVIVAIVFTSAWAAYSWLAHRSSSRAAAHHETTAVPSIPVVQAAPVAPVAKPNRPRSHSSPSLPVNSEPVSAVVQASRPVRAKRNCANNCCSLRMCRWIACRRPRRSCIPWRRRRRRAAPRFQVRWGCSPRGRISKGCRSAWAATANSTKKRRSICKRCRANCAS